MSITVTSLGLSGQITVRPENSNGDVAAKGRVVTDGGPGDKDKKKNGRVVISPGANSAVYVQVDKGQPRKWGDDDEFRRFTTDAKGNVKSVAQMRPLTVTDSQGLKQGSRIELYYPNKKLAWRAADNGPRDWDRNTDNRKFTAMVPSGFNGTLKVDNRTYSVVDGKIVTTPVQQPAPSSAALKNWIKSREGSLRNVLSGDLRAVGALQSELQRLKLNGLVIRAADLAPLLKQDEAGKKLADLASKGVSVETYFDNVREAGGAAREKQNTDFKAANAAIIGLTNTLLLQNTKGVSSGDILSNAADELLKQVKNVEDIKELAAKAQRASNFLLKTESPYDKVKFKTDIQKELTATASRIGEFVSMAGTLMKNVPEQFRTMKDKEQRDRNNAKMGNLLSSLATLGSIGFGFSNGAAMLGRSRTWGLVAGHARGGNLYSLGSVFGSGTLLAQNAWNASKFEEAKKAADYEKNAVVHQAVLSKRKDLEEAALKMNAGFVDFLDGTRAMQTMIFENSPAYRRVSEPVDDRDLPDGVKVGTFADVPPKGDSIYSYYAKDVIGKGSEDPIDRWKIVYVYA